RHCERSEAIQSLSAEAVWIASSHQRKIALQFCRELLAMTEFEAAWSLIIRISIADTASHPRGLFARALLRCLALNEEGAGKTGSRLAPMNRHAKSRLRVLQCIAGNRATGDIPAFPAQWLERLMSRSPRGAMHYCPRRLADG
ncbi:hypothetical protein, partial [Bradyrhizobium genosp. SA-3]|uniref:hypothetical protein n=1 Tax=Bradyrhizobium genosp. SA-3 TaxID=508868 RepID=UPI001ABF2E70